jgi:hypothetical protein
MRAGNLWRSALFGLSVASVPAPALAQDADVCLVMAERVDAGEKLSEAQKTAAHEACLRALSATGSVVQKYQFQEADFAITGTRHEF